MRHCPKCNHILVTRDERDRNLCCQCEVASWTPEKYKAMGVLVSVALRKASGESVPDEQFDAVLDEALKHTREAKL